MTMDAGWMAEHTLPVGDMCSPKSCQLFVLVIQHLLHLRYAKPLESTKNETSSSFL